jgi:molybdate transport system substrate-binding protein
MVGPPEWESREHRNAAAQLHFWGWLQWPAAALAGVRMPRNLIRAAIGAALALAACGLAQAAEVRVLTPGVVANSGLREVAAAYTAKTGVKVTIVPAGMGQIVEQLKTAAAPSDIVMLPMDLMGGAALDKAIRPGGFTPLGRVEIGLFKKAEAPRPAIDTVEKLATVLRAASVVFYSDPASGSMQAAMSAALLKRPEFAGAKGQPLRGDAEAALERGEGDAKALGFGLIHDPYRPGELVNPNLVGALPAELGAHMDMATAISARAPSAQDAQAFIEFMTAPAATAIWRSKGLDRY